MIEKENAVLESLGLGAKSSITANTRAISPFIKIITGIGGEV